MRKYLCEFLGTCVLVLFGCGVAVMTDADVIATSLAFGLSIVAVAYTIGKISGCHVNPAVSFAMWIDKRISTKDFIGYVIAQVLGAFAGSGLLALIINSTSMGDFKTVGLGANAFGDLTGIAGSNITMLGALVVEIILTFVFVLAVMGVTRDKKKENVAPIVIGLALVLVHLLGIKLTGTSVNPARSLAPAVLLGGEYLSQAWVFIVGPLVGAAFASLAIFFIDLEDLVTDKIVEKEELGAVKEIRQPEKKEAPVVVETKKETKLETKKEPKKVTEKKVSKETPKEPKKAGRKPKNTTKEKRTK